MEAMDVLTAVRDRLDVRTVIGEPIVHEGLTIIPAARVSGGGGGGGGTGPQGDGTEAGGQGMGFGIRSAPAGVFVVKGEDVSWRPAIDVNKMVVGGQIVAVVALLTLRAFIRSRRRPSRR